MIYLRILQDSLAVAASVVTLYLYFVVFDTPYFYVNNFLNYIYIVVGLFLAGGLLVGFFSYGIETYFILGIFSLTFIVIDILIMLEANKSSVIFALFLGWLWMSLISIALGGYIVGCGFAGMWLKILIVKLSKKEDKISFAQKIGIPKNQIKKQFDTKIIKEETIP